MSERRWRSLLRLFFIGVLAAAPLACMQIVTSKSQLVVASASAMCPLGAEGCPCTSGGGCDPGLYCDNGTCVSDSYGDAEYMYEEDLAPVAEPAPMRDIVVSPGSAGRSRGRRAKKSKARHRADTSTANFGPAPAEQGSAGMPEPSDSFAPETNETPRDPADEIDNARQVVYTATLYLSVFELDAVAELAESLPDRYGGWIESRYDYHITLRIRAAHLFEAIDQLSELGVVLDKSLLAEDVTAEYVDLESRIRVLEQVVAQLEALLARATTVELALKIRVELDRVRLELEAARVRMRELSELIDYSTLTLILSQRSPVDLLPDSNDPFPWVDDLGVEWTEYR